MSYTQIIYSIYLHILAIPLILGLFLAAWKKSHIEANLQVLGMTPSLSLRLRFYRNVVLDILRVAHRNYGQPIQVRPPDQNKLQGLRSGPGLFLSAHFHNWELMGSWLTTKMDIPLLSMALPFQHPTSQWLLIRLRRRMGIPVIDRDIPRSALKHILADKCFGMLWDQYPTEGQVAAKFFGFPLRVNALPAFLTEKSGPNVYFGALLPGGRLRLVQIAKAVPGGMAPERLARRYHRVLEILVKTYPDYWYGLAHRRFKDQISYGKAKHLNVSRETSSLPTLIVSRETKAPI